MQRHVFIVGSKGIPANYGGFETFVDKLTSNKKSENIYYHVACMADNNKEFIYNDVRCFNVKVPNIGAAKAVYYDIKAIKYSLKYIEENNIKNAIIYVLACRIGPFIKKLKKKMNKLGITLYVNPDGHEWKRAKWNTLIKKYWKLSEQLMVKNADLLICDSINIEKYIKETYKKYNPKTTYIAYGADITLSKIKNDDKLLLDFYRKHNIINQNYYLVVGRFVPENNYETIIKEFMKSSSKKDLVIITNVDKNKFYNKLLANTNFDIDKRIKFVGTVYDQELIKKIRENAFAYIHGHSVGGTNPSLLEALASTKLNLLYDINFNREVAEDSALYWNNNDDNLKELFNRLEFGNEIINLSMKSKNIIKNRFMWNIIISKYENLFNNLGVKDE